MDLLSLIERVQKRMGIEAELIKGLDIVEELITASVNRELYFSIESQDYSIAWVESSDQCFSGKSGYRIFQDGWDYVYSIHSTSPGIARCFYEDGGIVDYDIKHAPREYLLDFAVNLPQIIEAIRAVQPPNPGVLSKCHARS